jgi:hypothetical protein
MAANNEDLAKLIVRLSADTRKYENDLRKATGATFAATKKMEAAFEGMSAASEPRRLAVQLAPGNPSPTWCAPSRIWSHRGAWQHLAGHRSQDPADRQHSGTWLRAVAGGRPLDNILPGMRSFNAGARGGKGTCPASSI